MTLHFFSVERRDGLFGVGYLDFPDLIMVRAREDPEALKAMLEEVLEGVIRRTGLQLDAPSRQIFMRNNPGREASAAGRIQNKDAVMKVRIYLVENRLYQIMTVGEKNGLKEKDVDLFFYSFRLL
jgi:hypothetical protein